MDQNLLQYVQTAPSVTPCSIWERWWGRSKNGGHLLAGSPKLIVLFRGFLWFLICFWLHLKSWTVLLKPTWGDTRQWYRHKEDKKSRHTHTQHWNCKTIEPLLICSTNIKSSRAQHRTQQHFWNTGCLFMSQYPSFSLTSFTYKR